MSKAHKDTKRKTSHSSSSEEEVTAKPKKDVEDKAHSPERDGNTSPSLTPTRGRSLRRKRSARSESEASARPETSSRRPLTPPRFNSPEDSYKGKGKTKMARQRCPICWSKIGHFPHALVQHQRWSVSCLQWQIWNAGGRSWEECFRVACDTKERREYEAYERQQEEANRAAQEYASRSMDLYERYPRGPRTDHEGKRKTRHEVRSVSQERYPRGSRADRLEKSPKGYGREQKESKREKMQEEVKSLPGSSAEERTKTTSQFK